MDKTSHENQISKWRGIVHEAKESGMTTIDGSKKNGIPKSRFYYWYRKVGVILWMGKIRRGSANPLLVKDNPMNRG
jgi:hypothetical protein